MSDSSAKKPRISLTKRQLGEKLGSELLQLICEIVADGNLTPSEVTRLQAWLAQNSQSGIPAVEYLSEIVADVLADGVLTDSERTELHLALEKVLPVSERSASKSARQRAWSFRRAPKITRAVLQSMKVDPEEELEDEEPWTFRGNWRNDPMTEPQRAFIRSLGGSIDGDATKGEASEMIDRLLKCRPISSRQSMVLRFWNREQGADEGPREISEWMDDFYSEDPDRKTAWDLFKQESEDNGLQGDPTRVPLGIGPQYLARIKQGGDAAVPKFRQEVGRPPSSHGSGIPWVLKLAGGFLVFVVAVVIFFKEPAGYIRPSDLKKRNHESPLSSPATSVSRALADASTTPTAPPQSQQDSRTRNSSEIKLTAIVGGEVPKALIAGRWYAAGDQIERLGKLMQVDPTDRAVEILDSSGRTTKYALK